MSKQAIVALKIAVWLVCLTPLALLIYRGFTNNLGPDPTATVTHATGFATLRLLVISLAMTPLRKLSLRLSWLVRFRRLLGLFAFFYGCLHLLTWLWLYSGFGVAAMADDLGKRRIHHDGYGCLVAPGAAAPPLLPTGPFENWGKALAGAASAGVCFGHLWCDSLLVDRQERGAYTDHHHPGAGGCCSHAPSGRCVRKLTGKRQ